MKRALLLLLVAPLFGGCVHTLGGSVAGTECKFLERPEYAVRGATQYDQDWADSTVEGGIGACKWKRPAARPAELDLPTARAVLPAKKKKGLLAKIWPAKAEPVVNVPEAPAPAPAPVEIVPKPCSKIDELLQVCGK